MTLAFRRIRTMWAVETPSVDFELAGPHRAELWEPLDVSIPLSAQPYCCYLNTVIFYREKVGYDEIARVQHADFNTPSATLLFVGGQWWSTGPGTVVQRQGRWCIRWTLSDNTRDAIEANTGRTIHQRQAAGATN
jgi:hypothetical protein